MTANSFSGTDVDVEGTWSKCYADASGDEYESHVISGTSIVISNTFRSSTDGSCTGDSSSDFSFSLTLAADMDVTMYGWSDRTNMVLPPTALDSVTSVDTSPDYSGFSFTGGYYLMFIDDTGTPQRLYRAVDTPASPCSTPNGNYDEPCAYTDDYLEKE